MIWIITFLDDTEINTEKKIIGLSTNKYAITFLITSYYLEKGILNFNPVTFEVMNVMYGPILNAVTLFSTIHS